MALSYLIGSQGHFGQSKLRSAASTVNSNAADSDLVMTASNIEGLLELLTNSLHLRRKEGPGGYYSVSFSLKHVLFALRCLLTHTSNQKAVAKLVGREVNILLMKVLTRHTMDQSVGTFVDAESAENACFSLYLQSNYGFEKAPFLPIVYSAPTKAEMEDQVSTRKDLAAKILVSYLEAPDVRPAGKHAAEQLLLRLRYLKYGDEKKDVVGHSMGVWGKGTGNSNLTRLELTPCCLAQIGCKGSSFDTHCRFGVGRGRAPKVRRCERWRAKARGQTLC
jgi:hypothetical protein